MRLKLSLALSAAVVALVPAGARAVPLPARWAEPPILMYHRVDTDPGPTALGRLLTVTPQQLRDQLAALRAHGFEAISMADLEARLQDDEPLDHVVVLTFDDGYADQYRYAFPILKDAGARATFYIVTGNVGKPKHLTWDEIRTMMRGGMDMGAHGLQHFELPQMTQAEQQRQIDGSIEALEQHTGVPVESYAYPSGRFNATTIAVVARSGVALALTTDPVRNQGRFDLGRVRVLGSWQLPRFEEAIERAARTQAPVASTP